MKKIFIILAVGFLLLLGSKAGAQFATPLDSSDVAGWKFTTFTDVDDSLKEGHQIYEKIDSTTAVIDSAVGAERAAVAASVDEVASSVWAGRVSDETGTGLWVYGTSPTFTTDITSPLVIGGTATTSDLSLKTTSGVGETGADMHFLVGNNGATEAMTILNNGKVGLGTDSTSSILHVKANTPGTVGSHPAGQLIIQNPANSVYANAVITGYESDAGGNPDQQLWYLGGSSGSSSDVTLLNRRNSKLHLGADGATKMTILGDGNVGIGTLNPPERLSVVGNIATGDSTTGDVDVYHYFSTDGSWTTEYLRWDDGLGEFQFSDDLTVTGNITMPDDGSIGLGSAAGRIRFADDATDTVEVATAAFKAGIANVTALNTVAGIYAANSLTVAGGTVDISAASVNLPANAVNATAEISEQIIVGDHIDSVGEDFVFADPYRGTSAEAESLLLTHGGAAATYLTTTLTEEQVEDFVGGMLGGTETNITATYNDGDNDIDFVVAMQKDLVTTAPVTGAADDVFIGADADVTVALDFTASWDFGGAAGFEIPAVADPTTDTEGKIAWDADDDAIEVYSGDESESALIPMYQKLDAHIFAPDGIDDEICIFRVDALIYPHGIEIDQVSITLDSDAEYSMVFEEWAADPPTAENDISTVTTAADDAYAEEAPDTDAALDADDYIYLHVPSTDVDWIHVQVIFHVNDGN